MVPKRESNRRRATPKKCYESEETYDLHEYLDEKREAIELDEPT
jgi:hypothetical protein